VDLFEREEVLVSTPLKFYSHAMFGKSDCSRLEYLDWVSQRLKLCLLRDVALGSDGEIG
jgi:hypothetical protein